MPTSADRTSTNLQGGSCSAGPGVLSKCYWTRRPKAAHLRCSRLGVRRLGAGGGHAGQGAAFAHIRGLGYNTRGGCCARQGFAVGAAGGAVALFERERESDTFRRTKRAGCEGAAAQAVGSLAVSPGEEALLVSVDANQLFGLSLVSQDQARARAPPQHPCCSLFRPCRDPHHARLTPASGPAPEPWLPSEKGVRDPRRPQKPRACMTESSSMRAAV